MEMLARQKGVEAWIESTGSNQPQPGDVYVMNSLDGAFAHIGVVHTVGKDTWETMDSGQGRQHGDFTIKATKTLLTEKDKKNYNADKSNKNTLGPGTYHSGGGSTPDTKGPDPRKVHGWVDVDKLKAYLNS